MPAGVTCIDHPVWGVENLEVASERFKKLGFAVPPIGKHREWGTGNICIIFPTDYIEIRGVADRSRFLAGLDTFLEKGEGLSGVAFGTDSAIESHRLAQASGIAVAAPKDLHRQLVLADRTLELHFRNVMLEHGDYPGFPHANLCEHLTPDQLRQPAWMDHPNTAISVHNVVGVVDDLDHAERKYKRLLGEYAVRRAEAAVWLQFPRGATAEIVSQREAEERGIAQPARVKDYMAGITINVMDIDRVRGLLSNNGVRFRDDAGRVSVDRVDACGADLSFAGLKH